MASKYREWSDLLSKAAAAQINGFQHETTMHGKFGASVYGEEPNYIVLWREWEGDPLESVTWPVAYVPELIAWLHENFEEPAS